MATVPLSPPPSLSARRDALAAARAAVVGMDEVLYQAGSDELEVLLGELDELCARAAGMRIAVVAEAHERGVIASSQAGSLTGWVLAHAPSLRQGGGAAVG